MLDKPVEIIFLKMEGICQRLYGDVGVMRPYISGHFFEYDPVHRFALLFREWKIIFCADDREDAKKQPLADMAWADIMVIQFF